MTPFWQKVFKPFLISVNGAEHQMKMAFHHNDIWDLCGLSRNFRPKILSSLDYLAPLCTTRRADPTPLQNKTSGISDLQKSTQSQK